MCYVMDVTHVCLSTFQLDNSVWAAVCESQASAEFIEANPANAELI